MTEELAEQIHYSERVTLSDFIGQINDCVTGSHETADHKISGAVADGQRILWSGGFWTGLPGNAWAEKGEEFGITAEKRLSDKGNEYDVFFYLEEAQHGIVKWLLQKL